MISTKLFVFDIETIPDTDVLENLTGSKRTDIIQKRQELEEYHREVSGGNPFPRQPFHKVVSVSILLASIEKVEDGNYEFYDNIRIGTLSSKNNSEAEIVKKFFDYLIKYTPRIVSYNGRTFDIPVMKYRAMKYAISIEKLYNEGDRWNSYSNRYSTDWHCDLLETLSDFGASARCKMNEICSILGIPGKIGVDGSKVTALFDEGRLEEIDNYCETDVINTYLIYLSYALLRGLINHSGYLTMKRNLIAHMEEKNLPHFNEFLTEWKKADGEQLFAD